METVRDDMKTMIFYLMSGEEIQRINIFRNKTTIEDIETIIKIIQKKKDIKKCEIISENFDINKMRLHNIRYVWDLIIGNESIIKVNIIIIKKNIYISEIDVSKIIFSLREVKFRNPLDNQIIDVNYEEESEPLTFRTSPINIIGRGYECNYPDYIIRESDKKLLLPINENDSVSLIRLNEYLKSLEF